MMVKPSLDSGMNAWKRMRKIICEETAHCVLSNIPNDSNEKKNCCIIASATVGLHPNISLVNL